MENRESRLESVEQKTQYRSQELGDQQRIDEKARTLSGEQVPSRSSGARGLEVSRVEPQLGRGTQPEVPLDGFQTQSLCEEVNIEKELLKRLPDDSEQKKDLKERIKNKEEQVSRTPQGYCPTD